MPTRSRSCRVVHQFPMIQEIIKEEQVWRKDKRICILTKQNEDAS